MFAAPPSWRVIVLVLGLVLGVVVVRNVFTAASQVIGWAVAASVVALLLSPVVQRMDRLMPRPLAIVLTFVLVIALGGALTWLYTSSVLDQVAQLQESAPAAAERIERRDDRIGEIANDVGLADQVTELTARLDERTGSGGDVLRSAAMSLPPYFVSMILTIFLLIFGPRMIDGGLGQLSAERRARWRPALIDAARRTQIYAWASVAQAAVSGALIWAVGTWLGVPAIGLVALFGAVAALVPYVGIGVGWLPVLLLGLGTASTVEVLLAAAVAVAAQVAEWLWWRRLVDPRSLHVGPAVPVVVGILGFGVYGIGGAVYGVALAVLALAISDRFAAAGPDADLPTPVDDPDDDPARATAPTG